MKWKSSLVVSSFLFVLSACGGSQEPAAGGTAGGEAAYVGPIASSDVDGGHSLFATNCAGCHTGQAGAYGPSLRDLGRTPEAVRQVVREGRGRMPGFPSSRLGGDDLEKVMAFLGSIGTVAAANPQ